MIRNGLTGVVLTLVAGLVHAAEPNTLTPDEVAAGWELLFDGKDLAAWRSYGESGLADGWQVDNGTMVLAGAGAGDIVTRSAYENFELLLDWRISSGGNSGIFILVEEDENPI